MHQLRRVRTGVSQPGDRAGAGNLRDRSEEMYRMRRPLRYTAVRRSVPRRLHSAESRCRRDEGATAAKVQASSGGENIVVIKEPLNKSSRARSWGGDNHGLEPAP